MDRLGWVRLALSIDGGMVRMVSDRAVVFYTLTDYLPGSGSTGQVDRRESVAWRWSWTMMRRVGFKINTLAAVSRRAAAASTVRDAGVVVNGDGDGGGCGGGARRQRRR